MFGQMPTRNGECVTTMQFTLACYKILWVACCMSVILFLYLATLVIAFACKQRLPFAAARNVGLQFVGTSSVGYQSNLQQTSDDEFFLVLPNIFSSVYILFMFVVFLLYSSFLFILSANALDLPACMPHTNLCLVLSLC